MINHRPSLARRFAPILVCSIAASIYLSACSSSDSPGDGSGATAGTFSSGHGGSISASGSASVAGKTCLLVTHRPDLLRADRVAFLSSGRIVDQGSHDDLVARNDAYRSLLSRAEREGTT